MDDRATLYVIRLADMVRVHPKMTTDRVCSMCGEPVGIYPSGQMVIQHYQDVTLICNRCINGLEDAPLAPGAAAEPFESEWRQ